MVTRFKWCQCYCNLSKEFRQKPILFVLKNKMTIKFIIQSEDRSSKSNNLREKQRFVNKKFK